MEASKKAVQDFLARDGQHDTTVHETVLPAVVNEHITRTEHEEIVTAVEREVHQDHYHTSIQPIQHKEVLPETHTHIMKDVVTREFHHGSDGKILEGVEAERAQFKNTREVGEIQHTYSATPIAAAEHVHHHVHETIQPVIQKETVQHTVHHTIIPVHEVHHKEAKFDGISTLKPLTMAEFQASGGVLGPHGKNAKIDHFATESKGVAGVNAIPATSATTNSKSAAQGISPSSVGVATSAPTATSRALDSATAKTVAPVSGHTRSHENSGSISNLETKTERKFPLATGAPVSQTQNSTALPIRSSSAAVHDNTKTVHGPTTTTTTTTTSNHTSLPKNIVQEASSHSTGTSNHLSPAATSEAKRGGADYSNTANHTIGGVNASPTSTRKSVDTSRRSVDHKGRKSVDASRHDGEDATSEKKKESLLKRIIHKLE